jgi:hypothetical protein
MITLSASRTDSEHLYSVARDGRTICNGSVDEFVVGLLGRLGIEKPQQMIEAARQYGVVEIHEDVPTVGD